ncbi:tetratricopeptide repeat protein [Altererythrobacter arenosus]|uniref:Tetratricopeptide repeat protein n=1 Tax=Altererythrobacter arenosus TaxID=3032592 RepID=A0ABY8FXP5_9SPHN|nr:tetratricopeptide repeat protein [Altererythrobacter sp. CAU 1644]WFL79015.1 tetratricopeptide repeat protein [Altererythrobacter sp. CAU 1644]
MGLNLDEQKAVDRFRKDVVEPSMKKLVILDFWAEWCGPCKALAPVLEKVSAEYADKGVVLAKIDVDKEQFIAAQFQVQSIPTVYAMFQGQPVADLTNARSESQLKQVLDQLLAQLPVEAGANGSDPAAPSKEDLEQFLALGEHALSEGDAQRAAGIFGQVAEMAPDNGAAHAGLIRSLVQLGQVDEARAALEAAQMDPALANDPALHAATSALELAGNQVDEGELNALRDNATANPDDHEKQLAFAEAAFAAGSRDEAADVLLGSIEKDREWNDGAARTKLLQIFEAVGLEDEWVVATRRRLSKILFG